MYTALADLARPLGNAHRLILLEHIAQGERSVERLAELTGLTVANTSQHLLQLKRAGFVGTRRQGKFTLYRLAEGPVLDVIASLQSLAAYNLKQVELLSASQPSALSGVEVINSDELIERMHENSVVVLDVRSSAEFELGHLPGALNIPMDELASQLQKLPKDRPVVAYCRGPYCTLSVDAVVALNALGYEAQRLREGFIEWSRAGLRVETE